MKMEKLALRLAGALIAYQAAAGVCYAQAASTPAAAEDDASDSGDIVVTALKRSESLQEVPASISALSGEMLAQQGLSDLRDIAKVIPNLNWGEHFGTTLITIRGAGSNVDSGATEPTVALYVNGIYLPRSDMATFRAVDLERVEVLRGPQGTLYGRNAAGGAVNFISQAPSEDFTGKIEASTGSRSAWGVNGYLSGAIAPGFKVRVSGGREKQDGYVKVLNTGQRLNGVDTTYGRFAVEFEPSTTVTDSASIRYEHNTAAVAYQQPLGTMIFGPEPSPVYTSTPNRILADAPYGGKRSTFIASNTLSWQASDNLTIKSLTGYIDHSSHAAVDDDGSLVSVNYTDDFKRTSKSFSQEFNLVGNTGKLDWILGLFYFHEKYFGNLPVILGAGGVPPGVPVGATINLGQTAKISNVAAFADVTYHLSDSFSLNAGLRYNHEDNKYSEIWSFVPLAGPFTTNFSKKASKLLPKVALNFDLSPDVHSYIQWSKGYKSGGVNLPGGDGSVLPLYKPENISAFEAGIKSQLLDRTLTLNVAAWYYKYTDLQITQDIPPSTTVVRNANARLYGLEAELRWSPIRNFDIHVAPTIQHAVFDKFVTFDPLIQTNVDLDGSQLPRAPDFTINAGIGNTFELGGTLLSTLRLEGNMLYSSSVVLRYENQNANERQKSYSVANFSATIMDASEKTQLTAFLSNAFDTNYKQHVLNFGLGYMGNYAPPRTWGVRLSRKF
jgi:iron complex outermembrane recepter protein